MSSYDYKSLRLDSPLMSIQTQTLWLNSGWINVSQGKPQILMNWQNKNIQNWQTLIKKLLIVKDEYVYWLIQPISIKMHPKVQSLCEHIVLFSHAPQSPNTTIRSSELKSSQYHKILTVLHLEILLVTERKQFFNRKVEWTSGKVVCFLKYV